MSKLILPAALLAVLLCPSHALARDFGQRGTVFPVIERDLLEQIHSRLTQMERSGETARLNEDLKRRTIARVKRPDPSRGSSGPAKRGAGASIPRSRSPPISAGQKAN